MGAPGWANFLAGFNNSYDTTGRVLRDYELSRIAKAGINPIAGVTPTAAQGDIRSEADNDPSVAAVQPSGAPRYELLGKTYDAPPTEEQQTAAKQLAMAGLYERMGEVGEGMGLRREVRRDQLAAEESKMAPLRRRSMELGLQQQEQAAKDDAARRAAEAESQKWWSDRLTSQDGTKRAATPKDFTDFSQQRVYSLIGQGRMDEAAKAFQEHSAQAFVQINLQTAQRKADGENALQALYQGNTKGVLDWYNAYAPDGARATGITFGKDGSATVQRVGSDGKPAAPLTFKGGSAELAASIKQGFDPNAMMQWQHQQFSDEMQRRHLALAGAASSRAQAEFDAGAPGRALNKTLAEMQTELLKPDTPPARKQEIRTALAEAKGEDKNAPAQVKLAEAMVRAGLRPDMRSALEFAMTARDKSPEAVRADIFKTALTANMGNAEAARKTTEEAMRFLSEGGGASASFEKPKNVKPEDIASTAKKYGVSEDEVRRRLGL